MLLWYISAEQNEFYKNPETSLPLVISRNADLKKFTYTYYILNKYHNPIYGSKDNPRPATEIVIREKFFTSIEEYVRPNRIELKWNYTQAGKEKDGFVKDGVYELYLQETDKRDARSVNEYVYRITIDTLPPYITAGSCLLTTGTVYKNKQDYLALSLKNKNVKAHVWEVLLDNRERIYKEQCPYGEERAFPPAVPLQYADYTSLSLGMHELTLIAQDCAGNRREVSIPFKVDNYPFDLSIIGSGELVFKEDGTVKAFYYAGIGVQSKFWKTAIYDEEGLEHFSDVFNSDDVAYCKRFEWNGISKITQEKVKDGIYSVVLLCKDEAGNEIKQIDRFIVVSQIPAVRSVSYNKIEVPALTCTFSNSSVTLKFNRNDTVKTAVLKIMHEDELFYKTDIEDIQNICWDGYDENGNFRLSTGEEYDFVLETINAQDEQESFSAHCRSSLIYTDDDGTKRKKLIVEPIYFIGNDSNLFFDNQYFIQNAENLRKTTHAILEKLDKDDTLILVGNANYTTYPNQYLMEKEKAQLIELSRNRAEIVKRAFIFYGIPEMRIRVEANGGEQLMVTPDSADNWKNRRVEFFIEKAE